MEVTLTTKKYINLQEKKYNTLESVDSLNV